MPSGCLPFDIEEDVAGRTLTLRLRNDDLPSFTIAILEAMDALFDRWRGGDVDADTLVFCAATPAVFSMGGDLATIAALARTRDTATLRRYAHLSARVVHALWTGLDRDLVTVGAVDGKAFGSGFEAITACHVGIAGPGASFAFPESRFGLFPGMGGTSLMGRRASPSLAEALILSGRKLDAHQALAIGAIDVVTSDGDRAESYAKREIAAQTEAAARRRAEATARRRALPYTLTEAIQVVDEWVRAVEALTDERLLDIERIARMQTRRAGKTTGAGTTKARPTIHSPAAGQA